MGFDEIIIPQINCPPKYAIIKRNKYLIDVADIVIAFVKYPWGGSYNTLEYAKKKNKKIINLYNNNSAYF